MIGSPWGKRSEAFKAPSFPYPLYKQTYRPAGANSAEGPFKLNFSS